MLAKMGFTRSVVLGLLDSFLVFLMVFLLMPAAAPRAYADTDDALPGVTGTVSSENATTPEMSPENSFSEDISFNGSLPIDSFTTDIAIVNEKIGPDKEVQVFSGNGRIKLDIPKESVTESIEVEIKEKTTKGATGLLRLFELNAFNVDTSVKDGPSGDSLTGDNLTEETDVSATDNATQEDAILSGSNATSEETSITTENVTLEEELPLSDNSSQDEDILPSDNLSTEDTLVPCDNLTAENKDNTGKDAKPVFVREKKDNFHFEKELTISIQHTAEELAGLDVDSLHLYYLDEANKQWVLVPGEFDKETLTLTATITHFSYYGEQANPLQNGPGRVMASQVSLYSGTSSYSYPIELPPGPNGFKPSLNLVYNSGSVDGMKNKRDMGSWVGIGWSLHLGRISCDLSNNESNLDLNGGSYKLVSLNSTSFETQPNENFKITRSGNDNNTWTVIDKDGVKYTFGTIGSKTDATQYVYNTSNQTYRWDLSRIEDTNGNTANINYVQEIIETSSSNKTVRSAYPDSITYGLDNKAEIKFYLHTETNVGNDGYLRDDNPISTTANPAPKLMETRRLDSIEVILDGHLLRKYDFSYTTNNRVYSGDTGGIYYSGAMTLDSITQYGTDETSGLPATSFSYEYKQVYRATSETLYSGNPGNPAVLVWPFLTQVNSGYGGSVGFTYTQIPNVTVNGTWTRQAVTTKTVNGGIGSPEIYQYSYTDYPQYSGTDWNQEFRGWNEVTEIDVDGNYIKHYFYTRGAINGKYADALTGKEYATKWYDKYNLLLKEREYNWSVIAGEGSGTMTFYPDLVPENSCVDGTVRRIGPGSWSSIHDGAGTNYYDSVSWGGAQIYADTSASQFWYMTRVLFFFNTSDLSGKSITSANLSLYGTGEAYSDSLGGSPSVNIFGCTSTSTTSLASADYGTCQNTSFSTAIPFASWNTAGYNVFALNSDGLANINTSGLSRFSFREATYDAANSMPPWVSGGTINFSTYFSEQGSSYAPKLVVNYMKSYSIQLNSVQDITYSSSGNKTTQTRYVYDGYGNTITQYLDGDITNNTDNSTIFYTYTVNATANILSKVYSERVYAGSPAADNRSNALKETLYYYDGLSGNATPPLKGNLTRIINSVTDSSNVSSSMTYDSHGNILETTDPNGNTTSFTYDPDFAAYPHTKTVPELGKTEDIDYTWYWQETPTPQWLVKITSTDVNGNNSTTYYDKFDRLWKVVKEGDTFASPSIEYQYNNWGVLRLQNIATITKVSANESLWQKQYFDGLGRVIQVQSNGEEGHTIISSTTEFNERGLAYKQYITQDVASILNTYQPPMAGWKYSTSTYDALGRVIAQTGVDGTTVTHDYSTAWSDNVTNPRGIRTSYAYDAFNRLIQVLEYNTDNTTYANTAYSYDTLGNLKQVTDDMGNTTNMTYNWLGQKTVMDDPDMGHWTYEYDLNGNLWRQTDAKNQVITMVYDELNRLVSKIYPAGSGMTDIMYIYTLSNNATGQRTAMSDASGSTGYKFDARGRMIEEAKTVYGVAYITQYGYDGADRNTWILYPTGENVTQSYNGRGLPYSLSGDVAGTLVDNTLYSSLGAMTQIKLGNGITTTYSYWGPDQGNGTEQYGKLYEIKTSFPELIGRHLTINSGGKVIIPGEGTFDEYENGQEITIRAIPDPGYQFVCWVSDNATALAAAIDDIYAATTNITMNGNFSIVAIFSPVSADGGTLQQVQYTWDVNGNLTHRNTWLPESSSWESENFGYDSLDRLLSAYSNAYNAQTYAYNPVGNIVSKNGEQYTYGDNAHKHAVTNANGVSYEYDANGNIITRGIQTITWDIDNRVTSVSGNGSISTFYYDGDGKRVKKIEDGVTTFYINQYCEVNLSTGNVTSFYYLGGDLIASSENGSLCYFHQDYLNSTSLLTNTTGKQIGPTIKYLPFGEARNTQQDIDSFDTDKLFTGKILDTTGLYYYGARYYDVTIGRFLSPDTVIPDLIDPQGLNRYSYCLNNPLKYNDPTGHWPNWGKIWHGVTEFAKGVGDAFVETGKAVAQMVTNPVETAKAIGFAVTHPVETAKAIASSYAEKAGSIRGWGQIIGEVAITVATSAVGGGLAAKAAEKIASISITVEKAITPVVNALVKGEQGGGLINGFTKSLGKVHGNSLSTTQTAYGYALIDRDSLEILKFGETIHPDTRYSITYLNKMNAEMKILAQGTKREMHQWQNFEINYFEHIVGNRPPLNLSYW